MRYNVKGYKKKQAPIAKLRPDQQVLGGDHSLINPKKAGKKKKTLFEKLFG